MVDYLFLLAVGALGWGLSLVSYRLVARRRGWPWGTLQGDSPYTTFIIGLVAVVAALVFAADRGPDQGGWVILGFGILLAIFWTGFLRVGSQVSLLLAPVATVLLLIGWLGQPLHQRDRASEFSLQPGPLVSRDVY